jgi:hypothetical protein
MAVPGKMILLAALSIAALALPTAAAAQVPATNASGGQYLPATPGGGGNREEAELVGSDHERGASGFRSTAAGTGADPGGRIGLALPLALLGSLAVVAGLAIRDRSGE